MWSQVGYLIGPFLASGDAVFSDRTQRAVWLTRRANDRAQFHQRLIEVRTVSLARSLSPRGGPDQVLREPPEPGVGLFSARIFGDTEEAGEHANDIAVEDRSRLIERNTTDCAGGVTADAGQGDPFVELFRKPPPVPIDNGPCGLLKVSRAQIVSKTFPEFEDGIGSGAGQRAHVRQVAHPTLPVGDDRLDLGLLEHDFRNPDGVGITSSAPGQVARVLLEPVEQQPSQRARLWSTQPPTPEL